MTRGEWGEAQASELLLHRGCRIVARNFRTRYGELDIIAEHGEYLLFVEVKTRKNNHFASAREAVGPKKQGKTAADSRALAARAPEQATAPVRRH